MWANAQRDAGPTNIGGALCSTPQSVGDAQLCSNAAKTRKPLKLAGVPDGSQPLVGRHNVRTPGEDIAAEQVFSDCRYVP